MKQERMEQHEDPHFEPAPAAQTSFVGEVWAFLRERKLYWLAPIILALVLLGALFLAAGSAGPLSPFIYAL
mgnify:CR=1 FL=1